MHWRLKGLIQKTLGYVPGGDGLHYLLQRHGGGLTNFSAECESKLDDWRLMIGHMRSVGQPVEGACMMEMGTGWYPTFPFCSYLAGARRVHTYDLNRHLRPELTRMCIELIGEHLDFIVAHGDLGAAEVGRRYDTLRRAILDDGDLAAASGGSIVYTAPGDAARTGLDGGSVDWTFSNSVLEHVPGPVIRACMDEAMRILRPGGFMFHSVNCGDHYAYVDSSVTQLNYLRYSNARWMVWNNRFLYQNRLRAKDFVDMAEAAGFSIVLNTARATEAKLQALRAIPVDPVFSDRYTPEELCITSIDMVGQRPMH